MTYEKYQTPTDREIKADTERLRRLEEEEKREKKITRQESSAVAIDKLKVSLEKHSEAIELAIYRLMDAVKKLKD